MTDPRLSSFRRFQTRERKTLRVSQESLVASGALEPDLEPFPLVIRPNAEGVDLLSWAEASREAVSRQLVEHGAILFRDFPGITAERFRGFAGTVCPELLDYKERAAPRHQVGSQVYTSTEFPADQAIPLHHEMSYSHNWPRKILFYCDQPPAERGRTPIADDRQVIRRLDPEVQREFRSKQVLYVRNYGEGVDLSWQEAFQTDDRGEVEDYCRRAHMDVEWRDGDRLRTRAVRKVLATHPETGETVWFNHAHMFHESNLEPAVREALLEEFAPDELPRNAFFGDGSPIPDGVLDHIRSTYEETAVRFTWQRGDVLLVDNILASHGREPYGGERRILVAMGELHDNL